jgi:hypothetical protein
MLASSKRETMRALLAFSVALTVGCPAAALAGGAPLRAVWSGPESSPIQGPVASGVMLRPQAEVNRSPAGRANPWLGMRLFRPSLSGQPEPIAIGQDDRFALSADVSLTAFAEETGLGFDLSLVQSLEVINAPGERRLGAGAQLRLGRFQPAEGSPKGWYLFAGADGQQLTMDMNRNALFAPPAMRYAEQATVGDFQAGLSIDRLRGQLGLSYVQRDISFDRANRTEQFAAFTYAVRR